jgi:hypothetical protein
MHHRWGAFVLALAALAATGCDPSDDGPPPIASSEDAVTAFVDAWQTQDGEALTAMADERGALSGSNFGGITERVMEAGAITSFEVTTTGPPEESGGTSSPAPVPSRATVPYRVTYDSDAAARPVHLDGELTLRYEAETDAWLIPLSRKLLWPGIRGADDFFIGTKWLARGRILDRAGRVLARGSAERRNYPFGSLAGSTVGHLEPLTKADVAEGAIGEVDDLVGGSGIESGLEERLAGTPSQLLQVVDQRDRVLRTLGRSEGRPGKDVKTTLDVDVQRAAAAAYGGTVGGAVVMRPDTGAVLAVVSSAELDPNNYVGVDVNPFNRALSGLYPPGSSLKVVTSAAALDSKVVTADTRLTGPAEYKGVRNFESEQFASLDFATALTHSVNTAFAQVAEKLGAKKLTRYAEAFGFNDEPKMALHAATSSFPFPADEGDLLWSSVGQAQVLASPLQMASVVATVANGGRRIEPRILVAEPKETSRVISGRAAATLTRLMENVVLEGTGVAAQIPGVAVAGKTGTAEVDVAGERKNHAWFVCFAPAGAPRVAVAVVSEYGGVGGQVAAPLARSILSATLPLAP